jgi:hypothetical protein
MAMHMRHVLLLAFLLATSRASLANTNDGLCSRNLCFLVHPQMKVQGL